MVLISAYLHAILRSPSRTAIMASSLAGLYAFLYVLLAIQDYALLLGSLLLFALLALIMALTRNVDWDEVLRRS